MQLCRAGGLVTSPRADWVFIIPSTPADPSRLVRTAGVSRSS
nr:MAG TPA: hypothetical protein [Caudoviricetes sp.]